VSSVQVWTDGAVIGNPGPGGWAAIIVSGGEQHEISGSVPATTNNAMELLAAIYGLGAVVQTDRVMVVSDSLYVVNGGNDWMWGWQRNGWRRGSSQHPKPLLNADLWRRLHAEVLRTGATFRWVRGHSGVELNARCDRLASAAAQQLAGVG
jgi:ribonuclease HI